jgi:uncharacterized membrane protein
MYHGWNGHGWEAGQYLGFPWMGFVMPILFLVLIVLVGVALFRMGKGRRLDSPRERAVDNLIERWSRGEIDPETFKSMKKEIEART